VPGSSAYFVGQLAQESLGQCESKGLMLGSFNPGSCIFKTYVMMESHQASDFKVTTLYVAASEEEAKVCPTLDNLWSLLAVS
jgi:hypothetical protein